MERELVICVLPPAQRARINEGPPGAVLSRPEIVTARPAQATEFPPATCRPVELPEEVVPNFENRPLEGRHSSPASNVITAHDKGSWVNPTAACQYVPCMLRPNLRSQGVHDCGSSASAIALPSGSGTFTWRTPFE